MILDKKFYDAHNPIKGIFVWGKSVFFSAFAHLFGIQRNLSVVSDRLIGWPELLAESSADCDSCQKCVTICPTQALAIVGEVGKKPKEFILKIQQCTQCTFCVDACPTKVLSMGDHHQLAFHAEQKTEFSLI